MTDSMRDLLYSVADRAATYLETLDQRGVVPTVEALARLSELEEKLPDSPTSPEDVLALLDEIGSPATVATAGRRFFGFVIGGSLPAALAGLDDLANQPEIMCRGGSVIVSPLGEVLAGPLYDQEGMLLADLDLAQIAQSKFDFDVTGHYARPDVFQLTMGKRCHR